VPLLAAALKIPLSQPIYDFFNRKPELLESPLTPVESANVLVLIANFEPTVNSQFFPIPFLVDVLEPIPTHKTVCFPTTVRTILRRAPLFGATQTRGKAIMRLTLILAILLFAFAPPAAPQTAVPDLAPLPAHFQMGAGKLVIDNAFSVAIDGHNDDLLDRGAVRFLANLSHQTGIPIHARLADAAKATLVIHADHANPAVQRAVEEESYTLDITTSGAKLSAPTPLGILHGFETFLQLVQITPDGFTAPAIHIEDQPRFPWRGLMIDCSRHFIALPALRRNIDALAAVKLNVLHLHLSDNEGFRVESKIFPKLTGMGSDGLFYTQAEIRDLISYALDRGVRIVPEFDIPGHSTAWFVGYPELASAPGPYAIERGWGIFDPAMDPTREQTYKFLDKFIGEMAALFPDAYFHVGGDEVNGKQWEANPKIQAFMHAHGIKSNDALQQYFMARVQKLVAKHHKIMIGWDEILAPGLPKESVIQSWRGQDSLAAAAKLGYRGLLSHGYYLDLMAPASEHYLVDPMSGDAAALTPDQQKLILGGESCMWDEYVSTEIIDSRLWPRNIAIAERYWSPQDVRDVDSMYRRIDSEGERLGWLGLTQRTSHFAMLARLAGSYDDAPLRVLADAVEPVKGYDRSEANEKANISATSSAPLNHLVDSVPPESEPARQFFAAVNALAAGQFKDAAAEAQVRAQLAAWRDNDARLQPIISGSYLLKEVAPLSQNLSSLGAAGLQALDYIDKGESAPDAWKTQQLAMMQQARLPNANLLLMPAVAVQILIQASAAPGGSK
jgi:hexosaminidase